VAAAYIVDVSDRDRRSQNLGLVGAAFGFGFLIGPAVGGFAAEFGTRAPLFLAAGICFAGVLFGLFVLPESLSDQNRRTFSLKNANPFSSLTRAFALAELRPFLLVIFLITFADFTYPAIWAYWGKESFGWDPKMIAITLTVYGVMTAIVQAGLIRVAIAWLGEPRTIWAGIFASIFAFFATSIAPSTLVVLAIIPISALSHVAGATLQGIMSREVSDSEQGELQGILASITAVCTIFASLGMTALFFTLARDGAAVYFPGGPFLVAGLLCVLALIPLRLGLGALRARTQASG